MFEHHLDQTLFDFADEYLEEISPPRVSEFVREYSRCVRKMHASFIYSSFVFIQNAIVNRGGLMEYPTKVN